MCVAWVVDERCVGRCAGCGLSRHVFLCAYACGVITVMVSGSAALVGMCVVVCIGPAKCEASWLRHTRDVEGASWACISGAVSSAVCRVLYRSVAVADLCRRVCVAAPRFAVAAV
jgi:hypothetical protein